MEEGIPFVTFLFLVWRLAGIALQRAAEKPAPLRAWVKPTLDCRRWHLRREWCQEQLVAWWRQHFTRLRVQRAMKVCVAVLIASLLTLVPDIRNHFHYTSWAAVRGLR